MYIWPNKEGKTFQTPQMCVAFLLSTYIVTECLHAITLRRNSHGTRNVTYYTRRQYCFRKYAPKCEKKKTRDKLILLSVLFNRRESREYGTLTVNDFIARIQCGFVLRKNNPRDFLYCSI